MIGKNVLTGLALNKFVKGTICLKNSIFNVELNSASEISQKFTTLRAIVVWSENYHRSKIGGLA